MADSAHLVFVNGSHPGQSVELFPDAEPTRLGRGQQCELSVSDNQCSRVHAQIFREDGKWVIEDCGSSNGTLVNSSPLQRTALTSGDLIRIGETMLIFCEDDLSAGVQAVALGDKTRVRRIIGAEKRRIADDPIGSDSTSGPIRKLACLYRLSKQIYVAKNIDSLVRYAVKSVQDVLGASEARLCLRNSSGRMKNYVAGDDQPNDMNANVIANWVIEKDEALLLDGNDSAPWKGDNDSVDKGTCLAAPISGQDKPIGVIECFRPEGNRVFDVPDLEFLISVGQHIGLAIENLQHHERIEASNENLRSRLGQTQLNFIGECEQLRVLRTQIARVACSDVTVLVLGESGTGKEVVSQMVHDLSHRREGPMVTVNCAAFSDSLLESELFGHEKGAFTGADTRRKGKFEMAHGGTIFLDEVGELSASCQAKLLRLLEGKPFQRLGGTESIEVDARIVSATHRDLEKLVRSGKFRQDLWYRLRVVDLVTPPLRDRGDDIIELAEHFLAELSQRRGVRNLSLSSQAVDLIRSHHWPGNVRELRNTMERATVLASGSTIGPSDLGLNSDQVQICDDDELVSLAELERIHVKRVLQSTGGNKTKACEVLGITRAALYGKLNRMNANQSRY